MFSLLFLSSFGKLNICTCICYCLDYFTLWASLLTPFFLAKSVSHFQEVSKCSTLDAYLSVREGD